MSNPTFAASGTAATGNIFNCSPGRTMVFIDGANFYHTVSRAGFQVDYKRLYNLLNQSTDLVRINYYTAYKDPTRENNMFKFYDWLAFNGYKMVMKQAKEIQTVDGVKIKGNMDVELVTDILLATRFVSNIILFSGDSDFIYMVNEIQRLGAIRVIGVSSMHGPSPIVGQDLRKMLDHYVDITELQQHIEMANGRSTNVNVIDPE